MSTIHYCVGIGICGPIVEGNYQVGSVQVAVSYPGALDFGLGPQALPQGLSTLFIVSWEDLSGEDCNRLRSKTHHRHLVIHKALDAINEILLAYKMARPGHIDGVGIRTIGICDTLFSFARIDSDPVGDLNVRLRSASSRDPLDTTAIAKDHIASGTYPVMRRYTRCYELLEHGFYSEAFVIAFSIMDDLIQEMLHTLLETKGMQEKNERNEFLRVIKENRLRIYLGPLLKVLCGKSISDLWPMADIALRWLNKTRNEITHGGYTGNYSIAAVGIYACVKTLVTLHRSDMMIAEFTVQFFRNAKLTASWTDSPPDWVPRGPVAESMDFEC
jgi:hypothetical protein